MQMTLFPDYFALDETCCLHRAEIVMEKLAEIPLDFLATHGERNVVLRRLSTAGISSLAALLRLPRFEVVEWEGVGRFFLHLFDEMRQEVRRHPEHLIERWLLERAEWDFPLMEEAENPWSLHHYLTPALPEETSATVLPTDALTASWQRVEQTFTQLIFLLKHRAPLKAAVLHRFLLQGLSPEVIARVLNFPSRAAVMRLMEHDFLRPLLAGEAVEGLTLTQEFRQSLTALRTELLFRPTSVLEGLHFMSMPRFLWLLGLKPMLRTQAETSWACDFIVPRFEVKASRSLLHRVFRQLQLHPDYQPRTDFLFSSDVDASEGLLTALLTHHPWIESSDAGHRLRAEQLIYDFCRIGRILLDADRSLSRDEIFMRYEQAYLERPSSLSFAALRKRFPAISPTKRGQWEWTSPLSSTPLSSLPPTLPQEPSLFDGMF